VVSASFVFVILISSFWSIQLTFVIRSGLLYSVTTLPGVIFGSVGVYLTGRILDSTHQDWSYVFSLNAAIDVLGAAAFVALYNSKKEFE